MEKYEALRGPEYGWAWSDECAFYKKEAFDVLIGRIRDARGSCQWKGTTTPNGFNWLYESFVETPLRNSKIIKCKTKDNLANLGGDYFDTLKFVLTKRVLYMLSTKRGSATVIPFKRPKR